MFLLFGSVINCTNPAPDLNPSINKQKNAENRSMFPSADLSLATGKMCLTCHRRLPVSILSVKTVALKSLKRVTGRIFKISTVSNFKGAS
jgi:hypothetical protein